MLDSRTSRISTAALVLLAACAIALAQSNPVTHGGMHYDAASAASSPKLPGQDAFGALQEIVSILEADPATDWSKVDLDGLREHLIDVNEVTLHAKAEERRIAGGRKFSSRERAGPWRRSTATESRQDGVARPS